MQTPDEVVSRIMGACLPHLWEGRCVRHHSIILPDNATCGVAQGAAKFIRERDAEVRADERAKMQGRDAALRAWVDAGPRPDVHRRAKDVVRKTMPVLARALDEDERGLT